MSELPITGMFCPEHGWKGTCGLVIFCAECGERLEARIGKHCPKCQRAILFALDRFCDNCGTVLEPSSQGVSP